MKRPRSDMNLVGPIVSAWQQLGRGVMTLGEMGYLLRDTAVQTPRSLAWGRGRRLGWANLWAQMVRVGVRSIPIVSLVMFCVGAILALQLAPTLAQFGAKPFVAHLIAISVFRELGPLISAVVLTGFAGASIAAEIGSMTVSEEIEALEAHAINPVRFLVVPRVLATTVMMVCIATVGDIMGLFGGLVVSHALLDIHYLQYTNNAFDALSNWDFLTGLVKAAVFGAIIASLACYLGLRVSGGAEGVGRATTRTVVLTIVWLILVDLLFTAVFYFLEL